MLLELPLRFYLFNIQAKKKALRLGESRKAFYFRRARFSCVSFRQGAESRLAQYRMLSVPLLLSRPLTNHRSSLGEDSIAYNPAGDREMFPRLTRYV